MNNQRIRWMISFVLIATIGLVHFVMQRDGHGWGDDFSQYIQHARNLAGGAPYGHSGYVYNKHIAVVGPPTYPPGCPAILAPVYAVFGFDLTALKAAIVVSFLAALSFLLLQVRGELQWALVYAFLAVVGLNHYFLLASNDIVSDLPFLACLFLTLYLAQRAYARAEGNNPHLPLMLIIGLSIYAAFAVRTVGGVLLPTLWAFELLRYRRVSRPLLICTGLFASLVLLQETLLHSDSHYLDQFDGGVVALLQNSLRNAGMYGKRWIAFWHNGYSQGAAAVVFLATAPLAAWGYGHKVRQGFTVREVFPWMYLAVVFVFPAYQGERFLFPVLPLYVFYVFLGLELLFKMQPRLLGRLAACGCLLLMTGSYIARYTTFERGPLPEGIHTSEAQALFQFIASTTPAEESIVFAKPRAMALYTGRRCANYHVPQDDRELWEFFNEIQTGCIVTVERDEAMTSTWSEEPARLEYLRQFVQRNVEQFECVFENRDFRVWRRQQQHTAAMY